MDGRMDALALTQIHWGMALSSMVIFTSRGQPTVVNSCCLQDNAGQRTNTFFFNYELAINLYLKIKFSFDLPHCIVITVIPD